MRFVDPTADDVNQVSKMLEDIVQGGAEKLLGGEEPKCLKDEKYYEDRIRELEIQVRAFDLLKEKEKYEKRIKELKI